MWLISIKAPELEARQIRIHPGQCSIGRHPDNTVTIADPSISRHHLVIEVRPESLTIRDLGSKHKIKHQDQHLDQLTLDRSDRIKIGRVHLEFTQEHNPSVEAISDQPKDAPSKQAWQDRLLPVASLVVVIALLALWTLRTSSDQATTLETFILKIPFSESEEYIHSLENKAYTQIIYPDPNNHVIEVQAVEGTQKLLRLRTLNTGEAHFELVHPNQQVQPFLVVVYDDGEESQRDTRQKITLDPQSFAERTQFLLNTIAGIDQLIANQDLKTAQITLNEIRQELATYADRHRWQSVNVKLSQAASRLKRVLDPQLDEWLSKAEAFQKRGLFKESLESYEHAAALMPLDDPRLENVQRKIEILQQYFSQNKR